MKQNPQIVRDREALVDAQTRGIWATLAVFTRLSGPGWLQSAITLGGGSLAGALFLGALGGTQLLWLQLVAIAMGVVMLSAISYVALSTGERPFRSINQHINPVLGWGWLVATCLANMIWCMPQYSLCFTALEKNLLPGRIHDDMRGQLMISAMLLVGAFLVVLMNQRQGLASRVFDWTLKAMVGLIVICFVGVVVLLSVRGQIDWKLVLSGFVPDLRQWNQPTGELARLVATLSPDLQRYWTAEILAAQRDVMIGAAATAVGINMTFLLPYSMLYRGWDRPFRGLARFDLCTGLAIPYVLVTSCVVIASASRFHGRTDDQLSSNDPKVMQSSPLFEGTSKILRQRIEHELEIRRESSELTERQVLDRMANLAPAEKAIAASLVQRTAFELSQSLAPLLGESQQGATRANLVFGLGVFGMGFSTIIILMLINGFVFCEATGQRLGGATHVAGCLVAGISGAAWPLVWSGGSKIWLAVFVSTFAFLLLPIAYCTFMMMMNSQRILGDQMPRGLRRLVWNMLMGISVVAVVAAALTTITDKVFDPANPLPGKIALGVLIVYVVLVVIGFFLRPPQRQ